MIFDRLRRFGHSSELARMSAFEQQTSNPPTRDRHENQCNGEPPLSDFRILWSAAALGCGGRRWALGNRRIALASMWSAAALGCDGRIYFELVHRNVTTSQKENRPGLPPPHGRAGKPGLLQRLTIRRHCGLVPLTGWTGALAVTAGAISGLIFTVERIRSSFSSGSTWSTALVLSSESSTASANS